MKKNKSEIKEELTPKQPKEKQSIWQNVFVKTALEFKVFGLWVASLFVLWFKTAKKTCYTYTRFSKFKHNFIGKWHTFCRFWKENINPLVFISRLGEFSVDFSKWVKNKHKFAAFSIFSFLVISASLIAGATGYREWRSELYPGTTFFAAASLTFYITFGVAAFTFISVSFGFGKIIKSLQRTSRKYTRAVALSMSVIAIAIFSCIAGTMYLDKIESIWIPALITLVVLIYLFLELTVGLLTRLFFKEGVQKKAGDNLKGYLYLAPAIVPLLLFTFYPMINAVIMGFVRFDVDISGGANFTYLKWDLFDFIGRLFTEDGFVQKYLTLDWFKFTFNDPGFSHSLITTIVLMIITVPVSTGIAVVIAVCLNSIKKFQGLYQTVYFLPYVTAMTAVTAVWRLILDSSGILNSIFNSDVQWLSSPDPLMTFGNATYVGFKDGGLRVVYDAWAYRLYPQMFGFIFYSIWSGLAFKIVIFLTGLQGIDKQVYQAARIDQATKVRTFFKITLPLLAPVMLYITTTSMIGAFKTYTSAKSLFLNDPKFETIVFYMFKFIDGSNAYDRASAIADLLFIIIMSFTAVRLFVKNRRKDEGPEKTKKKKVKRADRILSRGGNM